MVSIIIGTHGSFSEEILRSAEMIFGKQENIATVTFETQENPDNLVEKYKATLKNLNCEDGLLFIVDLFGGSPFNAASRVVVENDGMDIITGVSLPMLLEIFGARSFSNLEELITIGKNAAIQGIKSLRESLIQSKEEKL